MFILNLTYVKPVIEVEKYLDTHISFLEKYYKEEKFICSGRKNPRTGGIILCNAKNVDEVNTIIKEDPFYKEKVATYEITEFIPTKYADNFKSFC
ncbi:YciI family protein [Clostridium saccharobutylicum]|uniref:YCII-related domain protein n=1 Tax=Clostridium saccharobutylicum TaxID=169679 RepID=A0A1S8NH80_CLOSA|nr:YciI family protein [Clostridium saccharobutylicum]OOM15807.1 YCII-related domain protein [Clostridium saccharobutylicum]